MRERRGTEFFRRRVTILAQTTSMDDLLGHSVTYRIAVGPHQGRKAFTLKTLPERADEQLDSGLAKAA